METGRFFKSAVILLGAGLTIPALATPAEAQQQMGTWQQQQISFEWLGDVTSGAFYTCQGLLDELTFLLKQSGARLNAPVRIIPCISTPGGSTLLTAKLDFSTFMPVGEQPSGQGSALPGSWRPVEFSEPHSFPSLQLGDCELVLEFENRLLKYFATRDIQNNLRCIPFEEVQYALAFQTFVPIDAAARSVGGR